MDISVGEDAAPKLDRASSALSDEVEGQSPGSIKHSSDTVLEEQRSLNRLIEAWNAFHAEHGLLSDEFSML